MNNDKWSKTVFRLSGLPHTVESIDDVAILLSECLRDISPPSILVFSLATSLYLWDNPRMKVSTLMFATAPSIFQDNRVDREWAIPSNSPDSKYKLILDAHFIGMTPLNDVKLLSHRFDCIAISGLSSHPFGSWQPKASDKTFMWIRDGLPKDIHGIRTIVYGYDTRLDDSQSFQDIPDIARGLINQLQAYGWASPSSKSVAFLAHSLGGLVLKQALVQLADSSNEEYGALLNNVRGAIFFGVPNLGMVQDSFRRIVLNNPNAKLIDDLGRNSNFIRRQDENYRRLDANFSNAPIHKSFKSFWAYETLESPTIIKPNGGEISPDGPPSILVSPESATARLVETNSAVIFPINATHSDIVKFTRESLYYPIVVSKLYGILSPHTEAGYSDHEGLSSGGLSSPASYEPEGTGAGRRRTSALMSTIGLSHYQTEVNLTAEFRDFRRLSSITEAEENEFRSISFDIVRDTCREIQTDQEREQNLMYMQRLEPFLVSMQQLGGIAEATSLSTKIQSLMAYVWGPMNFVLRVSSTSPDAFNSVLDAYQDIGEQIPNLQAYRPRLMSSPHLKYVVVMIYKDVLWLHGEILRQLKQREWKNLFEASWAEFTSCHEHIKESIARSQRLIIGNATFTEVEEIWNLRTCALHTFRTNKRAQDATCRASVLQWLPSFDYEAEQSHHRKTRSFCKSSGAWLLKDHRFQQWLNPEDCSTPLLWLNGIPGAGKTILASTIIDDARISQDATVVYFYCKYGDQARNSFISAARSILAQLLKQHPELLPYFHERSSMSGDVELKSVPVAKEMLQAALNSCQKTYVVIDGVDECGRDDRQEIAESFRTIVDSLPTTTIGSVRCLFISQDDGIARRDFKDLPTITIIDENQQDIKEFASVWHQRLEEKFGPLRSNNCYISKIITARAQGMFIFAALFAKYLEDQISRAALLEQLDPDTLPVDLDHVYQRILERIHESRGDHIINHTRKVLGWICCARRPLRWAEVQGGICIDLDDQHVDRNREISDSPKGLFASLVELREDGTVELVHQTAREFLLRNNFVDSREVDYSLAMLSIGYLTLPQLDKERSDKDMQSDLSDGMHSFFDYASACWSMHLRDGVSILEAGEGLSYLLETLELFIELHWSPTHKPLQDLQRVRKTLMNVQVSESFEKVVQAVGWAGKQSSKHGQGPNKDEALDLWQVANKIRSTLEKMATHPLSSTEKQRLRQFYGPNWFKCPRVNCIHYFQGFSTHEQREHHLNKHNRPFLCFVSGCHMRIFGYAAVTELKTHILRYHGIDMFDGVDDIEFPDPPRPKPTSTNNSKATLSCPKCPKTFTRNHNLKNHLRTHDGERPYACNVCGEKFTRKADCVRHERGHGENKFKCAGSLNNGSQWGCQTSFARLDKLVAHFRSKAGQKCVRPQLEEKLRDGDISGMTSDSKLFDGQTGENADALQAAGKSLPSFKDFLELCGLDEPAIDSESAA